MRIFFGIAISLAGLAAAGWAQPSITAVQDGAAYTANVAQGSVFVVKGSGLSAAGFNQGSLPLGTALNNVTISFTPAGGGTPVAAYMVYNYNLEGVNQLAAILPSSTATGEYDVRAVNAGQTSAPFRTRVVARKPGIVTADGTGSGPAQATTATYELIRFTTGQLGSFNLTPVRHGDAVVLWGTGLGADLQSEPSGGTSGDISAAAQVRVIVGGIEVAPLYAGRASGLPGTDQVNFIVPPGVAPGCAVAVQVSAGGVLSNMTSIAVAAPGMSACTSPNYTEDQLRSLSQGGSVLAGVLSYQGIRTISNVPGLSTSLLVESFYGGFTRFTANKVVQQAIAMRPGQCSVWQRRGSLSEISFGEVTYESLDAGERLLLNGPGVANREARKIANRANEYFLELNSGTSQTAVIGAGEHRVTGSGGSGVGAFNAAVTIPAFTWTNEAAVTAINRNQALTVNWTGGGAGWVEVNGFSGRLVGGGLDLDSAVVEAAGFSCIANASAGTLTVPVAILQQLPPASGINLQNPAASSFASVGAYAVRNGANPNFTAPLISGGTIPGYLGYIVGYAKLTTVQ